MSVLGKAGIMMLSAEMEPRLFDLDFQLLADATLTLIAVIALFFFLSYFLFNPAREFLNKRQERIKGELDEAKKNQEEAAALKAQPSITIAELANRIGVVPMTINRDITVLKEMSILQRIGGDKGGYWQISM